MEIQMTSWRPSALPAACAPRLPWAHQLQIRFQRIAALVRAAAGYGVNGFTGVRTDSASKRVVDVTDGVPPRGRPV